MIARATSSRAHLVVVVLVCAVTALFLTSCATRSRGIKLSEAAEEAKKKPEKQKTLQEEPDFPPLPEPLEPDPIATPLAAVDEDSLRLLDLDYDPNVEPPLDYGHGEPVMMHGGLILGGGTLTGDNFDGFGIFGLHFGGIGMGGGIQMDVSVLFIPTNLIPESELVGAVKDEFEFALDFGARRYLTPSHTFMGLYGLAGLRFGALNWRYANPIAVETEEGTDIIHSDWLGYLGPYVGAGVSLAQTSRFRFGVNATVGVKLYHWNTREGFDNDLFGNSAFFQVMVPVSFGRFDRH